MPSPIGLISSRKPGYQPCKTTGWQAADGTVYRKAHCVHPGMIEDQCHLFGFCRVQFMIILEGRRAVEVMNCGRSSTGYQGFEIGISHVAQGDGCIRFAQGHRALRFVTDGAGDVV